MAFSIRRTFIALIVALALFAAFTVPAKPAEAHGYGIYAGMQTCGDSSFFGQGPNGTVLFVTGGSSFIPAGGGWLKHYHTWHVYDISTNPATYLNTFSAYCGQTWFGGA